MGWNLYWFYAIYLGAIPVFIILGILFIFKIVFHISYNFSESLPIGLWAISIISCGLLIKKPYHKKYEIYSWEYDGSKIFNPYKKIAIQQSDIKKIFIGYEKKPPLYINILKNVGYRNVVEYRNMAQQLAMILELNDNKICFLQIALLQNGKEMQEAILLNNKTKVAETPYQLDKYNRNFKKITWYRIMELDKSDNA
jgi:hypothetical protein